MSSPEERFTENLALCEKLLKAEKDAIEITDADRIETTLARKDEVFEQLRQTGERLGYPPNERPAFASRLEKIFAAQKANLKLMQDLLSKQREEGNEVRTGKARLRMVKRAYLP